MRVAPYRGVINEDERYLVAYLAQKLGPHARPLVPHLLEYIAPSDNILLNDGLCISESLIALGHCRDAGALPRIIDYMLSDKGTIGTAACRALIPFGADAVAAIRGIRVLLEEEAGQFQGWCCGNLQLQSAAIELAGSIGLQAAPLRELLVRKLDEVDLTFQAKVAQNLAKIVKNDNEVAEIIAAKIKLFLRKGDTHSISGAEAIRDFSQSLGEIGRANAEAIDALNSVVMYSFLDEMTSNVTASAREALAKLRR